MPGATSRLDLPYPLGTEDAADGNDVIQDLAEALDQTVLYDQGALSTIQTGGAWESSVGTPGVAGRVFLVTSGYASVPLLFRDTGTGWRIESRPSFGAKTSAATNQLAASSVATKIVFDTEEWDDAAWFNPGTYRWVPQIAGVYRLSGLVQLIDNLSAGEVLTTYVYKNGAAHRLLASSVAATTQSVTAGGSCLVSANGSTDYFELYGFQNDGSTRRYASGSYFQGELVRPA